MTPLELPGSLPAGRIPGICRPGRRDRDRLCVAEHCDEVPNEWDRLSLVAGVVMHLTAAGLRARKVHVVPEPFQQAHDCLAGVGKEGVVETGDEQGEPHSARKVLSGVGSWKKGAQ